MEPETPLSCNQQAQRKVAYVVSQELAKISSLLPSNKKRSLVVHSLIYALGLLQMEQLRVINPRRASDKDLAVYHDKHYLSYVLDNGNDGEDNSEFGLQDDASSFAGLSDYVTLVAGATLTACEALKQGISDISICWDGGRHHTHKSRASGFCYVADCILALLSLKHGAVWREPSMRKPRVMYIDLDLHFSDAVSEAFHSRRSPSSTSNVLILSVHHSSPGFFPASKMANLSTKQSEDYDPFTLSIPLELGASNGTFARIWPIVENVRRAFGPDYVVVQCGVDTLAGDPYATFNWSLGGGDGSLGSCIERVSSWPEKVLLLGGGGYNSPNAARAWAYLTSIVAGAPLDLDTPIPDHSGFPLYGPSFTLDVPAGNMRDQNSEEYIHKIETTFEEIVADIRYRCQREA